MAPSRALETSSGADGGCYREGAGAVLAREVLLADAVNLSPNTCDRAGEGRRSMSARRYEGLSALSERNGRAHEDGSALPDGEVTV